MGCPFRHYGVCLSLMCWKKRRVMERIGNAECTFVSEWQTASYPSADQTPVAGGDAAITQTPVRQMDPLPNPFRIGPDIRLVESPLQKRLERGGKKKLGRWTAANRRASALQSELCMRLQALPSSQSLPCLWSETGQSQNQQQEVLIRTYRHRFFFYLELRKINNRRELVIQVCVRLFWWMENAI